MVNVEEISRYIGARTQDPSLTTDILRISALAKAHLHKRHIYRRLPITEPSLAFIHSSATLTRHLATAHSVIIIAATLGHDLDALARRLAATSARDALILQGYGAATIEDYLDTCEDEIRQTLAPSERLLQRYSPGYGDLPLSAQHDISHILSHLPTIIHFTASGMMLPTKSVTAVIGITNDNP